ncbi:MAG: cbb3-type cytochrome c oxidase subunit I [Gammaproteobacteria bacterium]|jgi:cytochrome c oxidase subunit I|nr:cbb3-type cytochrome c oxidase subunit I [Gammaproteobacteria bacterium]MBT4492227.1 cbb3-type cytochrome c oxidase subunit I [Gammaproteobacteria bacterium]MBT7371835.1 cbb3-type cytochrome c oxidase subunit I [Gammaproteobacteria bacterium]
MTTNTYILDIPTDKRRQLAARWLWLSILALFGAGIFSVLLVLARTPVIGEIIPYADFFHTALVIHVDLSVLVWILAFAGILFSLSGRPGDYRFNQLNFIIIATATVMIAVTGFLPDARPIMSNYVPVLEHPLFIAGLVLFAVGMGAQIVTAMVFSPSIGTAASANGVIRFGLNCTAVSILVALITFFWSWFSLPTQLVSDQYYELLFWGGGHVLQYTYTLLMMICWLWLASIAGIPQLMSKRVVMLIFVAGLLSVFIAPLIYLRYDVTHPMHRQMFTWLMSFGGSLATLPLGFAIYIGLLQRAPETDEQRSAHAALMSSLLLFGAGGVIGFMITGSDVTIPAHYHGCIVGVTLALMGTGYDLMVRLGYPKVNFKLARIQLWTYAIGQFLHIAGLVWSGGYGVARKTAGAEQGLDTLGRVAGMGLMGLGGLISAIGGFLFIVVAYKAWRANSNRPNADTVV